MVLCFIFLFPFLVIFSLTQAMKEKIKNQIGFIQIPILIAIIVGVLIIGGGGYFGIKEYKNYQAQKEKQVKEQEIIARQENETKESKKEEEVQKNTEESETKQAEETQEKEYIPLIQQPQSYIDEINKAIEEDIGQENNAKFIVMVICSDGNTVSMGSGTIFGLNRFVLTNFHVVEGMTICEIGLTDDIKKSPSRWFEAAIANTIQSLDIATLEPSVSLSNYYTNTVVNNLCNSEEIKLGDEIIIFGYPTIGGSTITVTTGVVSGFDGYYIKTSAKIEHGNSGGGAFLKRNEKGSCWFGIPTSVAQGELESLGYIINYSLIHEKANE